ncbi:Glycolipid 2-alpha-mannosyltransferase 2 [Rhodotorula toruloides]|nr:Glycolipid 2-alpha-mannosyltransferase 2 [Rhodotorula toruloides]
MTTRVDLRLPPLKFLITGALSLVLLIHLVTLHTSDTYARHASIESLRSKLGLSSDGMPVVWRGGQASRVGGGAAKTGGVQEWEGDGASTNATRANAAFVLLARNSDVWDVLTSVRAIEDRFNRRHNYPYVFLNDEPFSDEFKRHTSGVASGPCTYGRVPKEHWLEPEWIDEERAAEARKKMEEQHVIYGGNKIYRRMCRFFSGFVHKHPLLKDYDYYWRLDPNVKFYCDFENDPFRLMQEKKKKYGWVVSLYEYKETIETLWQTTKEFINKNPHYLAKPNNMKWISNDDGETYNRCHFWSNFEIADLNWLRSEAYEKYFEHLDRAGGFSYERWGDAPVHSIAAALFLKPEEVHYFNDHSPPRLAQEFFQPQGYGGQQGGPPQGGERGWGHGPQQPQYGGGGYGGPPQGGYYPPQAPPQAYGGYGQQQYPQQMPPQQVYVQQPQKNSGPGAGAGCCACLAGACLCCCAEEACCDMLM